jgi:hypothetical protein
VPYYWQVELFFKSVKWHEQVRDQVGAHMTTPSYIQPRATTCAMAAWLALMR